MLQEVEDLLQGEEAMAARITGKRTIIISRINTLNMTQIGDNIEGMNGNLELQVLGEVLDQLATPEGTESRSQATTTEGKTSETEGRTDIDQTIIDKMDTGQTEAQVGKEVEAMELREPAVMAMVGTPEKNARGYLTWGILR